MNKNIENLLKKNFWLKLLSLCIAIIIWAYVIGGKKHDVIYTAGLIIHPLPKGYAISNILPNNIHVKLRGSKIALGKLNKKIFFKIDGSSLLGKKNTIVLSGSYLDLPSGIRVINIHPKIIPVMVSRVIIRYVKVLPITTGKLQTGYYLKNINVFPQYIKVKGPKDIVGHLSVITTQSIDLSHYKKGELLMVSLRKPTKLVKILYNKKVNVSLTIVKSK